MLCTQENKVEHILWTWWHFILTDLEDLFNMGNNCLQEKCDHGSIKDTKKLSSINVILPFWFWKHVPHASLPRLSTFWNLLHWVFESNNSKPFLWMKYIILCSLKILSLIVLFLEQGQIWMNILLIEGKSI